MTYVLDYHKEHNAQTRDFLGNLIHVYSHSRNIGLMEKSRIYEDFYKWYPDTYIVERWENEV